MEPNQQIVEASDVCRRKFCQAIATAPLLAIAGCGGWDSADPAAVTPIGLRQTIPLGEAWASSSINVSVFREQSVLRIGSGDYLAAYVDPTGELCLHQITVHGVTVRRVAVVPRLSNALLKDGHCSANLGLSSDRQLHVMYGAHDTLPYYACIPLDDFQALPNGSSITARRWSTTISYPQFYQVGGTLQMWFRADPANEVHRLTYDATAAAWAASSELLLTPGSAERVYMNQLAVLGNRVALPWLYRLVSTDDLVRNEGLWLAMSVDAGHRWTTAGGQLLNWPVTRGDVSALVSVPSEKQLLNQTSSRFGPDGRLYLTWYAQDAEKHHQVMMTTVSPAGQVMGNEAISDSKNNFDLLGRGTLVLPLSRPQLVVSDRFVHVVYRQDNQLVVASRSSADNPGSAAWRYLRLDVGDLLAWEPSISSMHWEIDRELVVFVQPANQGQLDTSSPTPAQRASLYVFTEEPARS